MDIPQPHPFNKIASYQVAANGCEITFWGDENVLTLIEVVVCQVWIYENPLNCTL